MAKKPKTWTVTVEPVTGGITGMVEYGNYLHSNKHENHSTKNTEIIKLLGDYNHLVGKALTSSLEVDKKNTKGGPRMKSLAMSYVLSLPPVFQPTPEQWKRIAKDVMQAVITKLELPPAQWKDFIFTNLHKQKNSHMNLVIAKSFEGNILHKVDQRSLIRLTKEAFTQSVATHCQILTDDYQIVRETPENQSKRVPGWMYKLQLAAEEKAKNDAVLAKIEAENEKMEIAKVELARLLKSAEDWVKAVKKKTINEEKYEKEVVESYGILSNLSLVPITQRIEQIRAAAEEDANKNLRIKPK